MGATALVVGGTGPTGPHVLEGLLARGYDVAIFHRGTHEPPGLPEVKHIHGDPHFIESIEESLRGRSFDVVIAAYGRTRYLADALKGRTEHFLAIGGPPRYAGFFEPASVFPTGVTTPVREGDRLVSTDEANATAATQFGRRLVQTEQAVFAAQPSATYLIYPVVYGPRNILPWEWSVMRRVDDGRRRLLVPDDGLAIHSRGAPQNLAEFVLRAVDRRDVAAGQVYNCADDVQYSVRQFTELILHALGADVQIVGVPSAIASHFKSIYVPSATSTSPHGILDTSKARVELGYRDVIAPADAIAEGVAWYRANPITPDQQIPGFVDRFDYQLEDALLDSWDHYVERIGVEHPQPVVEEVHPMPHPKVANQLVDDRGR